MISQLPTYEDRSALHVLKMSPLLRGRAFRAQKYYTETNCARGLQQFASHKPHFFLEQRCAAIESATIALATLFAESKPQKERKSEEGDVGGGKKEKKK